jgi:hypothetical protein
MCCVLDNVGVQRLPKAVRWNEGFGVTDENATKGNTMSDFLIYAARLQDAGIEHLSVRLFTATDRTRMMMVTPHGSYPQDMQGRWPSRQFDLCGTDRLLERVKDDMSYSDDGPTAEKIQTAIDAHPLLADDLREWYADYLLMPMPTEDEIAAEEVNVSEADVQRSTEWVKGLLHGIDVLQARKAMKTA